MTATDIITAQVIVASAAVALGVIYVFAIGRFKVVHAIRLIVLILSIAFVCSVIGARVYASRKASISEAQIAENPKDAVKVLSEAISADPTSSEARFKRGIAYMRLQEPQNAYDDLQRASEGSKWNTKLMTELAKSAREVGNLRQGVSVLNEVISRDPRNYDALTARGITELSLGEAEAALKDFEAALVLANDEETRFYAHMNAGVALDLLRREDDAIRHLTAAVNLRPYNAQALAELASAYGEAVFHGGSKGSHEKALELANRALAIDPNSDLAGLTKAAALFYLGHREEGIQVLSSVIARDPNNPRLLQERAKMYRELGNFSLAQEDESALRRIPGINGSRQKDLLERP